MGLNKHDECKNNSEVIHGSLLPEGPIAHSLAMVVTANTSPAFLSNSPIPLPVPEASHPCVLFFPLHALFSNLLVKLIQSHSSLQDPGVSAWSLFLTS